MLAASKQQAGMPDYDLAIVGGGINGAGIARDAAGRGLRVLLVEQNDLAAGTSSTSTKLIHGGLRYLEHGWLRLVREALAEREILLRMAPHLIRPMRFVLPASPGLRSAWLLRTGLFIYDHLGGRELLPATRRLDLRHNPLGVPLKRRDVAGFEYSDCQADDSRLVVLNAVDAAERGATVRTYTRCSAAERGADWRIVLGARGGEETVTARVLVNATGPWLGEFARGVLHDDSAAHLRLVKGSHIAVHRLVDHDRGYIFQNDDRRVVFALPFARDFTLIGTTDDAFAGDPQGVTPSAADIDYLCRAVNGYLRPQIAPADVVWSFAGVRALYDDGSSKPQDATRDYVLSLDQRPGVAPLLTVYGGKITTYRRLAEQALNSLAPILKVGPAWTAMSHLPGGDFAWDGIDAMVAKTRATWAFLGAACARRLVSAYGTRINRVLDNARRSGDLGQSFGAGLSEAEVRYLMRQEWARTPDDVLWRRSKLGLRTTADERERLAEFMTEAAAS
jgi:glycerol-3-phosphate dehydrogenase